MEEKVSVKNIGIYVHIPFCKKKCEYCDFKSYVGKENLIDKYVKWVNYELKGIGEGNKLDYENNLDDLDLVKTIYIGGGTPSILPAKCISNILDNIRESFTIDNENLEVTIEVNPGTVDEGKLAEYKKCGINRLSIGLQVTQDRLLNVIGRIHTYKDFLNTYNAARRVGFNNINVDLMIGIPTQTLEDVGESIAEIIKLSPEHVSTYSLIIEEGTPFYDKLANNEISLPNEDIERQMYWLVKEKLEEAGYMHYEISNFAKKGYESKHNLACWNQEEYIGAGAAAHSYTNNVRYSNVCDIEEYINNYENNREADNFIFHEKQTIDSKMKEFMLLGLRKIDGIKIQDFKNKFGENPIYLFRKELEKLVKENLIEIDGDSIRLTNKGLDLANLVWEEFV